MSKLPSYPFDPLNNGETMEVAPGIYWVRMPLPFALNHINLWLLEDGDGWTIVDTGFNDDETRDYWRAIMDRLLGGRPLKRAIVTHFHPDHLGLAGWFRTEFDVPLWMTYTEWLQAHCAWGRSVTHDLDAWVEFCVTNGLDEGSVDEYRSSRSDFGQMVTPIPLTIRRIWDGERFEINGHEWRVITGSGHSAEHAALYCADLNVLISGDQVLPRITTNVSLWYTEPDGDPLRQFLESFDKFRALPADALVLPSHNLPFHGLHDRLDYLDTHHRERLDVAREFCSRPRTGIDVISVLFDRKIDTFQIGLALGEALAHLNYLVGEGSLRKYRSSATGKIVYERVAETKSAS